MALTRFGGWPWSYAQTRRWHRDRALLLFETFDKSSRQRRDHCALRGASPLWKVVTDAGIVLPLQLVEQLLLPRLVLRLQVLRHHLKVRRLEISRGGEGLDRVEEGVTHVVMHAYG